MKKFGLRQNQLSVLVLVDLVEPTDHRSTLLPPTRRLARDIRSSRTVTFSRNQPGPTPLPSWPTSILLMGLSFLATSTLKISSLPRSKSPLSSHILPLVSSTAGCCFCCFSGCGPTLLLRRAAVVVAAGALGEVVPLLP